MVETDSLTPTKIITAMEAGSFYASTGVTLKKIVSDENQLKIVVDKAKDTQYLIEFIGAFKNDKETRVLQRADETNSTFQLNPNLLFVRARITASTLKENPFQEGDFEMAWTQPILVNSAN